MSDQLSVFITLLMGAIFFIALGFILGLETERKAMRQEAIDEGHGTFVFDKYGENRQFVWVTDTTNNIPLDLPTE